LRKSATWKFRRVSAFLLALAFFILTLMPGVVPPVIAVTTETPATSPAALSATAGIQPLNAPPIVTIPDRNINLNTIIAGTSVGTGWNFLSGRNLRIDGDGVFRIEGSGTPPNGIDIYIAPNVNADIILDGVDIQHDSTNQAITLAMGGNVSIWLEGDNRLEAGIGNSWAGLLLGTGRSLTIDGPGTLTVVNTNPNGWGIENIPGSTVTINGGTITATGPQGGFSSPNNIVVNGGEFLVMDSGQLTDALAAIGAGTGTIRLGASFDHAAGIAISGGANITLETNGFTLNVNNASGIGLEVTGGASFLLNGGGAFNVTGTTHGVLANDGTAEVTNATATGANGVGAEAENGGQITVGGAITASIFANVGGTAFAQGGHTSMDATHYIFAVGTSAVRVARVSASNDDYYGEGGARRRSSGCDGGFGMVALAAVLWAARWRYGRR